MKSRLSQHHMYPTSRFPNLKNEEWNIKVVSETEHQAWHTLFYNQTPAEVLWTVFCQWTPSCKKREVAIWLRWMLKPYETGEKQ